MTYSLHPGAERDVADALGFYNEHAGPAVAERFLEEFERVAKLLVEHPDLGTPTTGEEDPFRRRSSRTRSYTETSKAAFEF
jgi:plasmid stabilization system protein ParE